MPKIGTLTKAHIAQAIIEQSGYTAKKASETVEIILEVIKRSLENGEDMLDFRLRKILRQTKSGAKGTESGHRKRHDASAEESGNSSGKLREKINDY